MPLAVRSLAPISYAIVVIIPVCGLAPSISLSSTSMLNFNILTFSLIAESMEKGLA